MNVPRIAPRAAWAALVAGLCGGSYAAGNAVAWRQQSLQLQGFAERDFYYNDCMANQKATVMADRGRAPGYPSIGYRRVIALFSMEQDCLEHSAYSFVSPDDLTDVSGVAFNLELPPPYAAVWRHPHPLKNRLFRISGIRQQRRALDAEERPK